METRRLTAIVFTDMVGFSAVAQQDEALALALVDEQRIIVRGLLPEYRGRQVETTGDGFLLEFGSAFDAVRFGLAFQGWLADRNQGEPSQRRLMVRVGIHLGDVLARDGGQIMGDSVNIAARIEPLAEPGGLALSRTVYDLVRNKIPEALTSMGTVALKNISQPIEVFRTRPTGPVEVQNTSPEIPPSSAAKTPASHRSVAVLPFVNMSSDPENEFLCDGISDDLITALAGIRGLQVPARRSSFVFKGRNEDIRLIGSRLGVTHLVEGSVRKLGDRLRITAQLIQVVDGFHVWSAQYDRRLEEVFEIQTEISRGIVESLNLPFVGPAGGLPAVLAPVGLEAYQLYLQGRFHFYEYTRAGLRRSIASYQRAIEHQPDYALAHAGLATSCAAAWFYGQLPPEETTAMMQAAADKAVALDPHSADAQTALAMVKFWYGWDIPAAERAFRRAIAINPHFVTAHEYLPYVLVTSGRADEAIAEARLALQVDPLSVTVNMQFGFVCWMAQRFDLALAQGRTLVEVAPEFFGSHWLLGWALWQKGESDRSIAELRRAVALGGGPLQVADLSCLLGRSGWHREAREMLRQLDEMTAEWHVPAVYRACAHAGVDELNEAFTLLERALEERHGAMMYLRHYAANAALDRLQSDCRFQQIIDRIRPFS